jgi:hypothetical protein
MGTQAAHMTGLPGRFPLYAAPRHRPAALGIGSGG